MKHLMEKYKRTLYLSIFYLVTYFGLSKNFQNGQRQYQTSSIKVIKLLPRQSPRIPPILAMKEILNVWNNMLLSKYKRICYLVRFIS